MSTPRNARDLSRRHLMATGAAVVGSALSPLLGTSATAAEPARPAPASNPPATALLRLNRFPHMVHEYFVRRVREIESAADRVRDGLKTRDDALRYIASARSRIRESFGEFPEKTPLNAKVTGTLTRDAYRIEKVIFESRPNFLVTANLYVPTNRRLPCPAVVGSCGHSDTGKAIEAYQSFAQGLARQGYVVLIFDPIGQGERFQYPDEALGKSRVGVGVQEHLMGGNQQFLVGEFFGSWRAWDGIRALDYLLTRPEVDPDHVGITGNSGGGTMTTWLCGLDDRWTMAAPSCFVTTFRRNLENELPADTEQCPPRVLSLGLDMSDFLAVMAPKPVMIIAQEKDYFDVRGATQSYERLKRLYALLGAEQNVSLFVGPNPHGYSKPGREAMYKWFNRFSTASNAEVEPALTIEKDPDLLCTPKGQVAGLGSRTVQSFTRDRAQTLAKSRGSPSGEALRAALLETLKLADPRAGLGGPAPDYRILARAARNRRYPKRFSTMYSVETEPGIQALITRLSDESHDSRPTQNVSRAVLYVSHHASDVELREESLVAELLKSDPGATFYACDVRGVGESRPDTCAPDSYLAPYGSDYFYAIHSIMLDCPYVGQKTLDVLRVLDWMKAQGHREIHLAARGWALPATFAALLSPLPTQVTLKNALKSYAGIVEADEYRWPLSSLLANVLSKFDLPDCYRELERKRLRQIDPLGASAA